MGREERRILCPQHRRERTQDVRPDHERGQDFHRHVQGQSSRSLLFTSSALFLDNRSTHSVHGRTCLGLLSCGVGERQKRPRAGGAGEGRHGPLGPVRPGERRQALRAAALGLPQAPRLRPAWRQDDAGGSEGIHEKHRACQ